MKKLYIFTSLTFLFFGCSKDFLKRYDKRVVGQWYISDINRVGLGNNSGVLAFREGSFIFNEDGSLVYTDASGNNYNGSWDIQKRTFDDDTFNTLHITAVDFNNQSVRSEFYDKMEFRGTNHFVGEVDQTIRTYVTHFRR